MKLEYKLTKEDYLDFNVFCSRYSGAIRKENFKRRYIAGLCYFVFPLLSLITDIPPWYLFIVSIITYVIWILMYPKYYIYRLKKIVLKMLKEDNRETIFGNKTLLLEGNDFISKSVSSESNINWEAILEIKETEKYIFILLSSTSGIIVPKRAFKDKEEEKEFLDILKTKVNEVEHK